MVHLRIGIGVSSIGRFLPLVGKAAGLFEKKGISVEIVNQQDEERVVDDIVTGATPLGTPNAPSLAFSLLKGNDLVIVGGVLNRPAFYLAANATIRGVAGLKGKKVGINQPRRMAGMVMLALLRRWGWDLKRDLTLVDLGLNDKSVEALRAGQIDAALLPPEKAFLAEEEGFTLVADSLDLDCHWVPLATTRQFLVGNMELVKKVASIYVESIGLFKSEPEATRREIGRWLPGLAKMPRALEKSYQLFAERFEPTLAPSLSSICSILGAVALQDPQGGRYKGIIPDRESDLNLHYLSLLPVQTLDEARIFELLHKACINKLAGIGFGRLWNGGGYLTGVRLRPRRWRKNPPAVVYAPE